VNHRGHHKFWIDSVAASTQQSDYHLLSSLKIKEPGHHNAKDALQNAMHQWLHEECNCCGAGILALSEE
jgi:phage gp46-like protein